MGQIPQHRMLSPLSVMACSPPFWPEHPEKTGRFRESRTEITISGRLFQKPDGNSQFPDRFGESCPAIGKVGRNLKKLSSILKSRTEIENSGRKFSKSDRILDFRPTFQKVVRNLKK